jgi:hypothetical protein
MKRLIGLSLLLLLFCTLTPDMVAQSPSPASLPEDALLEMKNYSLFVNRIPVAENVGTLGGKVVWFCLPDKGPFIISTNPHKGYDFKKVGVITGKTISFTHDDKVYEWVSRSSVLGDGTERELWLLVDAKYRSVCSGGVCFGGASPFEGFMSGK